MIIGILPPQSAKVRSEDISEDISADFDTDYSLVINPKTPPSSLTLCADILQRSFRSRIKVMFCKT